MGEKLTFDEFYDKLWGSIPDSVVSERYVGLHSHEIYEFTNELYRLYTMDYNSNSAMYTRVVESTLHLIKNINNKWNL